MENENTNYLQSIELGIENVALRPFDRYVLGPFLIYYGLKSKKMPPLARKLIVTAGIWQLYYNWRNYRNIPADVTKLIQNFSKLSELPKLLDTNGNANGNTNT